jgi:hypothetical protein
MPSLISQVICWPVFLVALLVFGFAPGAALRLIILAFPRNDPRRRELRGELHNVPRIERPFWVIEQLEIALTEGVGGRLRKAIRHWSPRRYMDTAARVLALAQQTADVAVADARREAEFTVSQARREADEILREARREAQEIRAKAKRQT